MDSIIDVVGRENIDAREVILYPEGIFYRAYGFSALRFIRSLRPYQAKKRHYKKLGAEVCYLGFPQAALGGLLPEGFKAETTAEGTVVVSGPFGALTQQEYDEWVRSIPLSVSSRVLPSPIAGTFRPPAELSSEAVHKRRMRRFPQGMSRRRVWQVRRLPPSARCCAACTASRWRLPRRWCVCSSCRN